MVSVRRLHVQLVLLLLPVLVIRAAARAPPLPPSPFPPCTADQQTVKSRLLAPLLSPTASVAAAASKVALDLQSVLHADGSWADVNYTDKSRGTWATIDHLSRIENIAVAVRSPLSPTANSSSLLASANAALRFWLRGGFTNPNWYWNEIGVPQSLANTFLLLEGRGLAPDDVKSAVAEIAKAEMTDCDGSCGGANSADMATITLQLGLITGDGQTVTAALTRLYSVLAVVPQTAEGIQADSSFHQHGAEELTGSYGAVFTNRMLQVYQLTADTSLAIPTDKLGIFASLVLDGQQWMTTASGDWALAVIGRSIATPGRHGVGFSGAALRSLPVRRAEMANYATLLESRSSGSDLGGVVGNRHFWDSDTMVHRRADFVLVVRMRSKRTVAARCINGACLGAQHVADGSLQLYPTDAAALRYLDMPAVWDWHSLPGITAPTDTPFLPCDPKQSEAIGYNWPVLMGGASFVGGASDGEYGAAAMEFGPTGLLHNTGFVLSRSHFAFDNAVVVLGTGLQAVGTPLRIATTVANERLSGMVWVDDGRAIGTVTGRTVLAPGNHTFCTGPTVPCPSWLWHNGSGIFFANNSQPIEVNITNRTGNFAHLTAHASATAAQSRTLPTFSVRIMHGEAPVAASAKDSFEYNVYPSVRIDDVMAMARGQSSLRSVNTASVQSVSVCGGSSIYSPDAQMQAVFWPSPGGGAPSATAQVVDECILGASGATVHASLPSIVLLRRLNATSVSLTASGVDVGGALVVTLGGVNLRCGGDQTRVVTSGVSATATTTSIAPSTAVELSLPTQQNLIGKSVGAVCTAAMKLR